MIGQKHLLLLAVYLLLAAGLALRFRELRGGYEPMPLWAFLALCAGFLACAAWAVALCV